jgi:hypothetical protein
MAAASSTAIRSLVVTGGDGVLTLAGELAFETGK